MVHGSTLAKPPTQEQAVAAAKLRDEFGHMSDPELNALSDRLAAEVRRRNNVCRKCGGDQFAWSTHHCQPRSASLTPVQE